MRFLCVVYFSLRMLTKKLFGAREFVLDSVVCLGKLNSGKGNKEIIDIICFFEL